MHSRPRVFHPTRCAASRRKTNAPRHRSGACGSSTSRLHERRWRRPRCMTHSEVGCDVEDEEVTLADGDTLWLAERLEESQRWVDDL